MDRFLYLAMNAAKQNLVAQASNANNIANSQTTAFKSDFDQFRSMPTYGPGYPARAYAMTERPGSSYTTGILQYTGRELDVSIDGQGWLAVKSPSGAEAYTRAGDLKINVQGQLQTGSGLTVLNENGNPIVIPPTRKLIFGSDGTISTIAQGLTPNTAAPLDRIKLVNPDLKTIEKRSDGLFYSTKPGVTPPDPSVKMAQGYLEGSNVNVMSAMVNMIELSRNYEYHIKVMKTASDNDAATSAIVKLA